MALAADNVADSASTVVAGDEDTSVQTQHVSVLSTTLGQAINLVPLESLVDDSSECLFTDLRTATQNARRAGVVQVVLDLGRQKILSSAVLELFLELHAELQQVGCRLRISNASALVREVLYVTGIEHKIGVVERGGDSETARAATGKQQLGDILVSRGVLTVEQLIEGLRVQRESGKRLGEVLIEQGCVTDQEVLQALSQQLSVPEAVLRSGLFDPSLVTLIDRRTLARLRVYPMFQVNNELTLATSNPQNIPCLREVENLTGCRVRPVLVRLAGIQSAIDESPTGVELGNELIAEVDDDFEVIERAVDDLDAIDNLAGDSPIINLVNSLIQRAVRDGASDLHIEPSRDMCRVRFRIDGVLYEAMTLRAELLPSLVSRLKVMANLDISERRLPQDGRIQVVTQGRPVDLRFSSLPGLYGEKVVLRILDKRQAILELDRLGMAPHNLNTYSGFLSKGHGLVLVTGPTGSGKTTSLYAALNSLNTLEKNIVTIEDPVEYQLDIVNQNEVRGNIGLSFAKILKHVLRQDPDIIMVGEIREKETAEIAVQAALTGHLVLSTLHTNDSAGAITRMIDMGVEPYLLSSALVGVVGQRLLRRVCPECKTTYAAPTELVEKFGWDASRAPQLAKGRGCNECYDSGYRGRLAVHETLPITDALQQMIMRNPSRDELSSYLRENKIPSLYEDGVERAREQQTTIEEVSRVVNA